ncbi:hypothetical protein [Nocardioides sp.]|uniref:hypothetical protein n=1 Tax=Nocardioides sp. TaxID=35761 RepID=UPI003D0B27EC
MSQEWLALVRQLCTPEQSLVVETIAAAHTEEKPASSTAAAAGLARRFGLSSTDADVWARSESALSVLDWPSAALDQLVPDGLLEEIGLDDAVAVVDRLARAVVEDDPSAAAPAAAGRTAA